MSLDSKKDLRATVWDVLLKRGGITKEDIDKRVVEIRVSMNEHGKADEFDMTLSNRDGYFADMDKFAAGDEIELYVYFADKHRVYMGTYTVDDITDESMPSIVKISGLASDTVKKTLRTPKTRGFERASLFRIVSEIAKEHGLTAHIKGEDIPMERKEQKEETDLAFLTRVAEEYGFNFRIDGENLYFIGRQEAEKEPIVLNLDGLVRRRTFRYKSHKTYKKMSVRYYDPQKKQYIESNVEAGEIKNAQTGKETIRAESHDQAERIARAKLKSHNDKEMTAEIDCLGVPELRPGCNVKIENEGKLYNGIWHIEQAEHRYSKQAGYTVNLRGYKIKA